LTTAAGVALWEKEDAGSAPEEEGYEEEDESPPPPPPPEEELDEVGGWNSPSVCVTSSELRTSA